MGPGKSVHYKGVFTMRGFTVQNEYVKIHWRITLKNMLGNTYCSLYLSCACASEQNLTIPKTEVFTRHFLDSFNKLKVKLHVSAPAIS